MLGEQAQGAGARHGQARRQAGAGRARGRRAAVALGRAGGRGAQALGRQALGRAGAGGHAGARKGERARGRASGRAAGRTVRAGHCRQAARARSLCARAGPAGPGWGFVHFDSVFFGPVRFGSFPSHQMNTVHGEIKFFEKKKLNKNQIKSNKILIKFSKNIIFKK